MPEWIAAAEEVARNAAENVHCPDCRRPGLKVRDVEYGWGPGRGLERHLVCTNCGAHKTISLRRALPCGEVHAEAEAD